MTRINQLSFHPDGKTIAFNTIEPTETKIWVMQIFCPQRNRGHPDFPPRRTSSMQELRGGKSECPFLPPIASGIGFTTVLTTDTDSDTDP
jgi:hypothetical protein